MKLKVIILSIVTVVSLQGMQRNFDAPNVLKDLVKAKSVNHNFDYSVFIGSDLQQLQAETARLLNPNMLAPIQMLAGQLSLQPRDTWNYLQAIKNDLNNVQRARTLPITIPAGHNVRPINIDNLLRTKKENIKIDYSVFTPEELEAVRNQVNTLKQAQNKNTVAIAAERLVINPYTTWQYLDAISKELDQAILEKLKIAPVQHGPQIPSPASANVLVSAALSQPAAIQWDVLENNFFDAVQSGNLRKVEEFFKQNFQEIKKIIKGNHRYTTNALYNAYNYTHGTQGAIRNLTKAQDYLEIARFLLAQGAMILPDKTQLFSRLEEEILNAQPSVKSHAPVNVPVIPARPAYKPSVSQNKPTAFVETTPIEGLIKELESVRGDLRALKEKIDRLDINTLTQKQKEDLMNAANQPVGWFTNYSELAYKKALIKMLNQKGIPLSPGAMRTLQNQVSARAHQFETPLIEAIQNNNVDEVRRLIVHDKVDVNEPAPVTVGTTYQGKMPLQAAANNRPNKEIIELLINNGADISRLDILQKQRISQALGRRIENTR